jgi:hypothetical protein
MPERLVEIPLRSHDVGVSGRSQHDWGDKTAWRLFNAATFALADKVAERPALIQRLHEMLHGVRNEMVVQG